MRSQGDRSRAWTRRADVVVIFASLFVCAFAVWVPLSTGNGGGEEEAVVWWSVHAVAGPLGLAGVFAALRWPWLGKLLPLLAGLVLLGSLLLSRPFEPLALLTAGLPGLLLVVAAPFVGPMPSPEEEGEAR